MNTTQGKCSATSYLAACSTGANQGVIPGAAAGFSMGGLTRFSVPSIAASSLGGAIVGAGAGCISGMYKHSQTAACQHANEQQMMIRAAAAPTGRLFHYEPPKNSQQDRDRAMVQGVLFHHYNPPSRPLPQIAPVRRVDPLNPSGLRLPD